MQRHTASSIFCTGCLDICAYTHMYVYMCVYRYKQIYTYIYTWYGARMHM